MDVAAVAFAHVAMFAIVHRIFRSRFTLPHIIDLKELVFFSIDSVSSILAFFAAFLSFGDETFYQHSIIGYTLYRCLIYLLYPDLRVGIYSSLFMAIVSYDSYYISISRWALLLNIVDIHDLWVKFYVMRLIENDIPIPSHAQLPIVDKSYISQIKLAIIAGAFLTSIVYMKPMFILFSVALFFIHRSPRCNVTISDIIKEVRPELALKTINISPRLCNLSSRSESLLTLTRINVMFEWPTLGVKFLILYNPDREEPHFIYQVIYKSEYVPEPSKNQTESIKLLEETLRSVEEQF